MNECDDFEIDYELTAQCTATPKKNENNSQASQMRVEIVISKQDLQ